MGNGALHGAADAIDTVVGLLGRETLQGLDNILVLFNNQVVGTVSPLVLVLLSFRFHYTLMHLMYSGLSNHQDIADPPGHTAWSLSIARSMV